LGLISLGLLFMLLAVCAAFTEMQTKKETAEKELALIMAELSQMVEAIEEQDDSSLFVTSLPARPEGWFGMHES
jgi:inosine/xanthosine triphosphate pyrophosphatase family protein